MTEMTKREFLNAVIALNADAELTLFAEKEIMKMDASNAKRKSKNSEKHVANAELATKIVNEFLSDEPKTATEIGEAYEISTQKASALMRMPEVTDLIVKTDIKVKGKGKVKGYTKAQSKSTLHKDTYT